MWDLEPVNKWWGELEATKVPFQGRYRDSPWRSGQLLAQQTAIDIGGPLKHEMRGETDGDL